MHSLFHKKLNNLLSLIRDKGSFTQNLAVVFSGKSLILVIGFLTTPIMTRVYPPETYGTFAIFTSIIANISLISTFLYPAAFVLPKREKTFYGLLTLTFILSLFFTFTITLTIILFKSDIKNLLIQFKMQELTGYLHLIPVGIIILSLNNIISNWNIRRNQFKRPIAIDVSGILISKSTIISYGILINNGPTGFIFGELITKIGILISKIIFTIKKDIYKPIKYFSIRNIIKSGKEYRNYPIYMLPGNILGSISSQAPLYILAIYHNSSIVGLFAFSNSMLNIPMNLIISSIAPVFLQKISAIKNTSFTNINVITKKLYYNLLYIGLIPFCTLTVYGKEIFSFIFGKQWTDAGVFASFMGIYFIFQLISSPLTAIYRIYNKEYYSLIINSLILLFSTTGLIIGNHLNYSNGAIIFFSIGNCMAYALNAYCIFYLLKINYLPILLRTLIIVVLTISLLYLFKILIFS